MYYIYHILGVKIGCTKDLQKRMSDQGFTEWEILETYTDGWLAGDREIELQKEYGYPVDTCHYMVSLQNRPTWTEEARAKGKAGRTAWGAILGKMSNTLSFKDDELIQQIRSEYKGGSKNQHNRVGPTLSELAEKYNTSISTISRICRSSDAYGSHRS